MDFDEYDYLEKTVENSEAPKPEERANGVEETDKKEDKERRQSSRHRSEKSHDERSSKRAKSGEESRDRDTERGSSRHRSSPKDSDRSDRDRHRSSRETRDRDKDKGREERNGKGRDRDRERERDRDRGADRERDRVRGRREHGRESEKEREDKEQDKDLDRPHRSGSRSERTGNDRDKEKSRDRETKDRDGEKSREREVIDRDGERSRDREVKERVREKSRDREVKDRDRERSRDKEAKDRDREKSRDREAKDREKEREIREPERESRRYKDKKDGAVEPEVDPERDQRTVFAYQISLKADERDVYEFFSRAGKVRDVRLIMDRNSRRSKGVGYIEFYDAMSVPMAIALSGQPLLGQPVMVKPSEAEKNLVQSTTTVGGVAGGTGAYAGGARKLYVGNLHYNMKEDQLRQVFESFGTVELVQLPTDETGNCKGFGFIQFARLEDARAAQSLNGQLEIAGRMMKVSAITDQTGMQEMGVNPGDFDDDDGGGLSLNARSRALLMQKLDRTGTAPSVIGSMGIPTTGGGVPLPAMTGAALAVPPVTVPSAESVGVPSECLLLNNMFDPELEDEPDFDLDIKEDVQSESSKYGKLRHIYVEKNSAGFVYLRFENAQSAVAAQRALHGRWFAGKMITATFMLPQDYETKFPDSV
ncbi:splicing factor, CC1-like protein [Artemisia annua]|uniref:Splicing factor, CC1-like protein n=1 Tax=Artemisia annua TaxID=35608 RepID=A0A2U1MES8_ARTAN|nr:splicing factor, CC1-like protein [Artemisia annua]